MTTHTNSALTAALTLALAVGLTACGASDGAGEDAGVEPSTSGQTTGEGSTPTTDERADEAGEDESVDDETGADASGTGGGAADDLTTVALTAVDTAESETGGTAYAIDDQDDDGTWEVDVAVGDRSVEVTVSEDGLTVVETEDDDLDEDDRAGLQAATITLREAVETAVSEVGGILDDAELEEEDGTDVWEVTVDETDDGDDDVEVLVDARTGDVVSVDA